MMYHSKVIQDLSKLEDNWDSYDGKKPHPWSLEKADYLLGALDIIGQEVYHIAPGPNGEVMVEIHKDDREAEVILYPDKDRYVIFGKRTSSKESWTEQGDFEFNKLEDILK